jgi:hypothetical protein
MEPWNRTNERSVAVSIGALVASAVSEYSVLSAIEVDARGRRKALALSERMIEEWRGECRSKPSEFASAVTAVERPVAPLAGGTR